jgi:glycosyltransferase involved in cell wall biosynthesis
MDPVTDWAIGVVVPARNEAERIGACLRSVLASAKHCSRVSICYTVVVADTCDDGTAGIARDVLSHRGGVIECRAGSVGRSRALGTQAVLQYLSERPASKIWLANTDADTEVPVDWLDRQLAFAEGGYHGVAGIVTVDTICHDGRDVAESLMADYQVLPDGTHTHVHGANMGVRADAYLEAGGWSNSPLAEDHCLWRRLRQHGSRLAATASLQVKTSGRLEGRAAGGFAATLRKKLAALHFDVTSDLVTAIEG